MGIRYAERYVEHAENICHIYHLQITYRENVDAILRLGTPRISAHFI